MQEHNARNAVNKRKFAKKTQTHKLSSFSNQQQKTDRVVERFRRVISKFPALFVNHTELRRDWSRGVRHFCQINSENTIFSNSQPFLSNQQWKHIELGSMDMVGYFPILSRFVKSTVEIGRACACERGSGKQK